MAHPNPAELPGPDVVSRQPTAEELRSPEILLVPEGEKKVVDSVWLRGSDKVYVSGPTSIDITIGTERQKMQVFETEEQLWEFVLREEFVFDHIRGGKNPDVPKGDETMPEVPEVPEVAEILGEPDTAWRKELDIFRERFERATQAYRGMIGGEWKRFLEATFPLGKVFTEEKQVEIWKTELLPRIRKSIFEDIVRRGIDPEKAEEVISAMLRELDEERNRKMAEKEAARVRKAEEKRAQASLDKQSTT